MSSFGTEYPERMGFCCIGGRICFESEINILCRQDTGIQNPRGGSEGNSCSHHDTEYPSHRIFDSHFSPQNLLVWISQSVPKGGILLPRYTTVVPLNLNIRLPRGHVVLDATEPTSREKGVNLLAVVAYSDQQGETGLLSHSGGKKAKSGNQVIFLGHLQYFYVLQ